MFAVEDAEKRQTEADPAACRRRCDRSHMAWSGRKEDGKEETTAAHLGGSIDAAGGKLSDVLKYDRLEIFMRWLLPLPTT